MKGKIAKTLGTVHTHTHTHTQDNLINKKIGANLKFALGIIHKKQIN